MNRDEEFIARLEDYLETYDGVVPLPASVRDAVQAGLPVTRQVRGAGVPERILGVASRVSGPARLAIGAAAVVAILVLGTALLNQDRAGPGVGAAGTGPVPSSSPTPAPSATSTAIRLAAALESAPCGEHPGNWCIPAGTYELSRDDSWSGSATFDLPAGWTSFGAGASYEGVLVSKDAEAGSGWGVVFLRPGDVRADPCNGSARQLNPASTATVDGLIAAMRAWPGFVSSTPEPIEVDGYAGTMVDLTYTGSPSLCPSAVVWSSASGALVDAYPMIWAAGRRHPGRFRVVDTGGSLLVIRTTEFAGSSPYELSQGLPNDPERHLADLAELRAIVDSVRITP